MNPHIRCFECGTRLKIVEEDTTLVKGQDVSVFYVKPCSVCVKHIVDDRPGSPNGTR